MILMKRVEQGEMIYQALLKRMFQQGQGKLDVKDTYSAQEVFILIVFYDILYLFYYKKLYIYYFFIIINRFKNFSQKAAELCQILATTF